MRTVKRSSEDLCRSAQVDAARLKATTEADITRYAREDDTQTDELDFDVELEKGRMRVVYPLNVAAIRAKTGLSQNHFAKAFRISAHTLRNWEQGRRVPEGPARALLLAIDRDPEGVMRALGD